MRVDIRKLDGCREVLDACVAERCIVAGESRFAATMRTVEDLGYIVAIHELDHWYFASAMSDEEMALAKRIYLRYGARRAAVYEARCFATRSVIAYAKEDAVVALGCRLLDPEVDVFLVEEAVTEAVFWSRCKEHRDPSKLWSYISEEAWEDFDMHCGPNELRSRRS